MIYLALLAAIAMVATLAKAADDLRRQTWRTDPCLAWIIDRENPPWDPTLDFGGGHGNTSESYGLPQANPGWKMASAGADWRTNGRTQLRWARSYARRYGGTCGAKAFWISHSWW